MKTFLLADSGSTKTTWIYYADGNEKVYRGTGLNPLHLADSEISRALEEIPFTPGPGTPVFFFGAGCAQKQQATRMEKMLRNVFGTTVVEVKSDIAGACQATVENEPGIVCILGTGSAAARYDGKVILQMAPSPGYLLGDEGSGNAFGKKLVAAFLRNELPPDIPQEVTAFLSEKNLPAAIYSSSAPAAELASFFPLVATHCNHHFFNRMIREEITLFFDKYLHPLQPAKGESVHFCGSVAHALQPTISALLSENNLRPGKFIAEPVHPIAARLKTQKD